MQQKIIILFILEKYYKYCFTNCDCRLSQSEFNWRRF